MSADGKIASANGAIPNVGSKRDKQHMMELRTHADAIMSGARTVDLNSVTLGPGSEKYRKMRLHRGLAEYNLRIIVSGSGKTHIFIYPPFQFQWVDALLTNFHLPRSTLLMLVSAFASPEKTTGRELIVRAYEEAVRERYRFFSYGDAMLLL